MRAPALLFLVPTVAFVQPQAPGTYLLRFRSGNRKDLRTEPFVLR